jgi:deoxyribodipyrimidine photo-lyase
MRRDLRLADNPALAAAANAGRVAPLFVLDPKLWGRAGANRRAFLVGCLRDLNRRLGGHLVVRHGPPEREVQRLAREVAATSVYATTDFAPYGRSRDQVVERALEAIAVETRWIASSYAVEPGSVRKADGTPFRVFTPFSRAWALQGWEDPWPRPPRIQWVHEVGGDTIPAAPTTGAHLPPPGESAALRQWVHFKERWLNSYDRERNLPFNDRTSRLSPYLKWGCLHPRTLLAELDLRNPSHRVFQNELCWREFYADVLFHQPAAARTSVRSEMAKLEVDAGELADNRFEAWANGMTGYPIVDAGMRQLLAEGWMHNRVRMIVASFLVKDLHLDWTRGARHFMMHLTDGDLASNSQNWQWVAGTGTDAAPYFRVFNPVLQGRKFDPDGSYIRRWVPELARVPAPAVHEPFHTASSGTAATYPRPIVDHVRERAESLNRLQAARRR